MKCVIPSGNVKILARALYSLGRIGEELYLEVTNDSMIFRAVNSSRSAYACFKLSNTTFFASFSCHKDVKCKLPIKSFILAFKSPASIDKMVDRCSLELDEICDKLVLEIYCKHDIIKIYRLSLIEYEALEAVFEKEGYKNMILAQSRLLLNSIQNFQTLVEEVTVIAKYERMVIKNYIEDEPDPNQVIRTELSLELEEFDDYQLQDEAELTFCLKELRAVLSFAESCSLPVLISFHTAGRPIVFNIQGISGMESEFVLATLSEQTESQLSTATLQTDTAKIKTGQNSRNICSGNQNDVCTSTLDNNYTGATHKMVADIQHNKVHNGTQSLLVKSADNETFSLNQQLEQENDDEVIPSTPPAKRFRSKFLGLSQLSHYTSMAPDPDEILAEASDVD